MARKKNHSEHHEEHADETWLIPYSDLLTLLLALFIVLFASSSIDKNKASMMEYAFASAFSAMPPDKMNGTLMSFLDDIKGLDLGEQVSLGSDSKGAIIEIGDLTLFNHGTATIKPESLELLKPIARVLMENRYKRFRIIVEGHTDDSGIREDLYPSNWELSAARAAAVVKTLGKMGIEESRFQAVGMADIAPKYPNMNAYGEPIPENRIKNRRVVIRVDLGY